MRFRRANLISTRNTYNFHYINNCSAPAIFCLTMKMKVGCKMCILQDFALTLQKLKHLNVILSTKAKVFRMIKLFLNICMHDILGTLYTLFVFFTAIETYLVRKKVWEMYLSPRHGWLSAFWLCYLHSLWPMANRDVQLCISLLSFKWSF